jgi:hypothetical protein
MSAQDSGWFLTAEISRRGRVQSWRYPPGVTDRDYGFMDRVTQALPGLVDTPTDRIRIDNRWFTP